METNEKVGPIESPEFYCWHGFASASVQIWTALLWRAFNVLNIDIYF